MDKAAQRQLVRQGRADRPADAGRAAHLSAAIRTHPAVAPLLGPGATVAVYVGLAGEPPTQALRADLAAAGQRVLLPVALPDRSMVWLADPGTQAAAWGLPGQPIPVNGEPLPADVAIIVVPSLAATPDGRRLGQGGGYYDRLLVTLAPAAAGGPLVVTVVGPDEVFADVPTDPHDVRVDVVIVA